MMSTDRPFVREPAQRRDGYGFTIPKKVPIAPEQAPRTVTGNAVYVAGKALPREAAKRLNDEVRALRDAEQVVLRNPADAQAQLEFDRLRSALHGALTDVFGERFRSERLMTLQPGSLAPPQVA